MSVCRLMEAHKYDEVLKVESKYRYLDIFSNDPFDDMYVLYAIGTAHNASPQDEACVDRAIHSTKEPKSTLRTSMISTKLEESQ